MEPHSPEAHESPANVAVISTWAEKCGIADYARQLVTSALGADATLQFLILAADTCDLTSADADERLRIVPVWTKGADEVERLVSVLEEERPAVVHIQFQYGFFPIAALKRIIETSLGVDARVLLQLHKVVDPQNNESFGDIAPTIARVQLVYVHNEDDRSAILSLGVDSSAVKVVHIGHPAFPDEDRAAVGDELCLERFSPIVSSFGFLLPHKGIAELISAGSTLRREFPDLLLLLVCALYPSQASVSYLRTCRLLARDLGLDRNILFVTDFLPEPTVMKILHAADVLVLPYLESAEAASAAVRTALSASRPVITTVQPPFQEVRECVLEIGSPEPDSIASAVRSLVCDESLYETYAAKARDCALESSWPAVAGGYVGDLRHILGRRAR